MYVCVCACVLMCICICECTLPCSLLWTKKKNTALHPTNSQSCDGTKRKKCRRSLFALHISAPNAQSTIVAVSQWDTGKWFQWERHWQWHPPWREEFPNAEQGVQGDDRNTFFFFFLRSLLSQIVTPLNFCVIVLWTSVHLHTVL